MHTVISIQGLQAHGFHGLFDEERRLGQKFLFDLEAELAPGGSHLDDGLQASVRYDALVEEVLHISDSQAFRTLEALAESVARALLQRFGLLARVRVGVAKLSPPLRQALVSAGVAVTLDRAGLAAAPRALA